MNLHLKQSVGYLLLVFLVSYANVSRAEFDITKERNRNWPSELIPALNQNHPVVTSGSCDLYIEQGCYAERPDHFSLVGSNTFETLQNDLVIKSGFIPKLIKSYPNKKEICSQANESLKSISFKRAGANAVKSDFVMSWWKTEDGSATCGALLMRYDNKIRKNGTILDVNPEPLIYRNIKGERQLAVVCRMNLQSVVGEILNKVGVKCIPYQTVRNDNSQGRKADSR